MPCDWRPTTVTGPNGISFTETSSWHFIAELAENGHPIQEIMLEQPKGDKGYVMTVKLDPISPLLYIKVQLKRGRIWGRSFHYSTQCQSQGNQ
jgi:hypothetical protein